MQSNHNLPNEEAMKDILKFASILTAAKVFGKMHLDELKVMRSTCAFQDEIDAGSSKVFSQVINGKHSSAFNAT